MHQNLFIYRRSCHLRLLLLKFSVVKLFCSIFTELEECANSYLRCKNVACHITQAPEFIAKEDHNRCI
jgi:hypothetical protein